MPNLIEYAKLYQQELDTAAIQDATSGWMEQNAGRVQYHGGREVKIPKLDMDGLGDYDRQKGYPDGSVALEYQTRTMTRDRGRRFMVDSMDVDESSFILTAPTIMGEFQRRFVVPELDAYRYSTLGELAAGAGNATFGYTPNENTLLSQLKADITAVANRTGSDNDLIITMPYDVAAILDSNEKISRHLSVIDFQKGEITTKVQALDGVPIIRVQSARFQTGYTYRSGRGDEEKGGFAADEDATRMNWLICRRTAPLAISKTDKVKLFTPEQNQTADAWIATYRKYHDLWVLDNALDGIHVNLSTAKSADTDGGGA